MTSMNPPERRLGASDLRGLAHPLRVQILDVLSVHGPQTASSLAARVGESSGVTSYHLRQLAKHEFVREIEGRGSARERWWERVPGGISLVRDGLVDDGGLRAAFDLVEDEWERARRAQLDAFVAHQHEIEQEWYEASAISTMNLRLTSAQLAQLTGEVMDLIDRYIETYRDQFLDPVEGSRPVQIQLNAFPVVDGTPTSKEQSS